ncbi:MAG: TetR/AcrR family transcriptional regulator [Thermoplasmata archaeon]|nr:TetR/AcrR family transcriptional regulator [Thermoplasmata archaeon]
MRGRTKGSKTTDSRERILKAALEVFGSKGFTAATTKEIAERAGVNEVTVFRQFKSKNTLFFAVLTEKSALKDIVEHVRFDADAPLEELIVHNVRTALTVLQENRHLFMVVLGDAWRYPKSRRMLSETVMQRGIEFLTSMMARLVEEGRIRKIRPEVAARALMGMVQGYFITRYMLGGDDPDPVEDETYIRGFASVFVDGVRLEEKVAR